jgi:DNA invertase Pin-like site-specific DNA recombinase
MGDLLDAAPSSRVTIHTANGTVFDRRYAELLAAVAKIERDSFQERAQTGKRGRAKAGRLPVSRTPYGYRMVRADDGRPRGRPDHRGDRPANLFPI